MRKRFMYALAVTGLAAFTVVGWNNKVSSEFDLPALNQQVQHHEDVLNNHEARIENLENDTQAIQEQTGATPSPDRVVVPAVPPQPEPPQVQPSRSPAHSSCLPEPCQTSH